MAKHIKWKHERSRATFLPPPLNLPPTTEAGAAQSFAAETYKRIRYTKAWGFVVWDEAAWRRDEHLVDLELMAFAKRLGDAGGSADNRELVRSANRLASRSGIENAKGLLQSLLNSSAEDFDADTRILACVNGIVDLRSGRLRPALPEDLVTRVLPLRYKARARAKRFVRFIKEITNNDPKQREFLQRLLGYCITGSTAEQKVFLFLGEGANGKSTLVQLLYFVLGEFASAAAPELLFSQRFPQHPTGLANLKGRRVVFVTEVGRGRQLDEETVKRLTGGDTISARFMHKNLFDFSPTHKLVLVVNHRPRVDGQDHALWRRVVVIPFERRFSIDEGLLPELKTEAEGIFAWLVEGAVKWNRHGLRVPEKNALATDEYKADADVIGRFLECRCAVGAAAVVSVTDLYAEFLRWAQQEKEEYLSKRAFGERVSERGFKQRKGGKGARFWVGLRVAQVAQLSDFSPEFESSLH